MPVSSTKMSCAKGWQHRGSVKWSSRGAKVGLLEVYMEEDHGGKHTHVRGVGAQIAHGHNALITRKKIRYGTLETTDGLLR